MSGVLRATSADITTVNATDVNATSVDATPVKPGQIIEIVTSVCDGSTISTQMGDIVVQNVTAEQSGNTDWTTITGSQITYQPPPEAKTVLYRFEFTDYWVTGTHNIHHYIFYVGGVEVTAARHTRGGYYPEHYAVFQYPIKIGVTADSSKAKLASWDTPLELRMDHRRYSSTYYMSKHGTRYWGGGGGSMFHPPIITLTAIA